MVEACDMINAHKILFVKPEGKTSLGRSRRRWEDNTKMDLKCEGVGWIGLTEDMDS
jgi:hypothetical protein